MKKVISPLRKGDTGAEVKNLQEVLQLLLEKGVITQPDTARLQTMQEGLETEQATQTCGDTTFDLLKAFQEQQQLPLSDTVDEATAAALNTHLERLGIISQEPEIEYQVQGRVFQDDASPLASGRVRVLAKELGRETLLAEGTTDRQGTYTITWTAPPQQTGLNLIVRVADQQKNQLASSKILFNAKPSENVDIHIAETSKQPESKYERITGTLKPLLGERLIRELREDVEDNPEKGKFKELSYLAGETGIAANQLSLVVAAEKMGHFAEVSPEICYGLLRKGLPADLYALGEQGRKKVEKTLKEAAEEQLLPASTPIEKEVEKLFLRPEIKLVNKPLFLAKPEILFKPLGKREQLEKEEKKLVDARLNRKFRDILVSTAGSLSAAMNNALRTAADRLHYADWQDSTPATILREGILPGLREQPELVKETVELEKNLDQQGQSLAQLLHLDKPMQDNPLFFDSIRRAKTLTYTGLAGMNEDAQDYLVEADLTPDKRILGEMQQLNLVTKEQADKLLLTLDLARLTGDNLPLIQSIKGEELDSTRTMVSWSKEDWLERISAAGDALPPEEKPESYADKIMLNIEQTYPSQSLLVRLTEPTLAEKQSKRISGLQPLLHTNERLINGREAAVIEWDNVEESDNQRLNIELSKLTAFANTYKHLGFIDLINDQEREPAEKTAIVKERLGHLSTFYGNNEGLDLRLVNLAQKNDPQINWQDIPEDEQPRLRRQLMACQRTLALAPTTSDRQRMLSKGFDSGWAVTTLSKARFIEESGLSKEVGDATYMKSTKTAASVHHAMESLRETRYGLSEIGMANTIQWPPLYNALKDMTNLEDLFGSLNYCSCKECASILGPAAYFVDLMRFIDEDITQVVKKKRPWFVLNSLNLERRRRDLWQLPLTCENTHTLIPYLTIVNEVLTAYLEGLRDIGKGQVSTTLGEANISFQLPFNLPLAELRIYLSHFGITLYELYRFFDLPSERIWPARLEISAQELHVITTPDKDNVKKRYGLAESSSLSSFDVQDFLFRSNISREELDELRKLKFNPDLSKITIQKEYNADDIQFTGENLRNLTKERLDYIHRFIRLWKKTDWTIPELDLLLCALTVKEEEVRTEVVPSRIVPDSANFWNISTQPSREFSVHIDSESIIRAFFNSTEEENDLHKYTVEQVARLAELQETLNLSVEELCALISLLPVSDAFPQKASRASQQRLMDRLFDVEALFEGKSDFEYYHYSLDENAESSGPARPEPKTPLLLAGLGVSETELLLLFELLKERMPFDNKGETTLDRKKLSLLYRHARLAKALKWSIEEFIQALRFLFGENRSVDSLQQIYSMQEFQQWLKASPFTVFDLVFLVQGIASGSNTFSAGDDETAVFVFEYQKVECPLFSKDLLAEIDDIDSNASGLILEQMAEKKMLVADAGSYQIDPTVYLLTQDFKTIFEQAESSAEVRAREGEIREKLNEYHPLTTAYTGYANIDLATYHQAIRFSSAELGSDDFLKALQVEFDEDDKPIQPDDSLKSVLKPVQEWLNALERTLILSEKLKFKPDDLRFIADTPDAFGIHDLNDLAFQDIQALMEYRSIIADSANAKDIHALLKKYQKNKWMFILRDMKMEELATMSFLTFNNPAEHLEISDLSNMLALRNIIPEAERGPVDTLVDDYRADNNHFFGREANARVLGDIWQVDATLIESLARSLVLPPTAISALAYLRKALDYSLTLGINGFSLRKLVADDKNYEKLQAARDVALGAFSAKYEDENVRREKLEPYQDRINVIKRDALCDYILAREKDLKFKDRSDIYSFFLLDVEMSGCFRTSRLVCALSSLQLYVHRVFANLEQSAGDRKINVLKTLFSVADEDGEKGGHLEQIRKEWEWRKNFRVWQANRKVFLYPENYTEPDLRDNKTPIFRELEDELLQEKITKESAEAAYKKYLTQFSELARLRISGNYYHEATNTYYFFGRTTQDPPQYYYRMWKKQEEWTPWEKIELGINAEYVSAIIHRGKLYLFWVERKETEESVIRDGTSKVLGITIETKIYYSFKNESKSWVPSQEIKFKKEYYPEWNDDLIKDSINNGYFDMDAKKSKPYNRIYLNQYNDYVEFSIIHFPIVDLSIGYNYEFLKKEDWDGLQGDKLREAGALIWAEHNDINEVVVEVPVSYYFYQKDNYWYRVNFFKKDYAVTERSIGETKSGNFLKIYNDKTYESPTNSIFFTSHSYMDLEGCKLERHRNIYSSFKELTSSTSIQIISGEMDKDLNPDIDFMHNKREDYVVTLGDQQYLTQWKSWYRNTIRLTTSLVDPLGEKLSDDGLEGFLSLETQYEHEKKIGVDFHSPWVPRSTPFPVPHFGKPHKPHIDFKGAYGLYYRELFFHIPFLIAHHLNANQKFEEAKWWYERIFDPTGTEAPDPSNPNARNWRYLEFREEPLSRLKDILTEA